MIWYIILMGIVVIILLSWVHYRYIAYKFYSKLLYDKDNEVVGVRNANLNYIINRYSQYKNHIVLDRTETPTLLMDYQYGLEFDYYMNRFYIIIDGVNIRLKPKEYFKYLSWLRHEIKEKDKWNMLR